MTLPKIRLHASLDVTTVSPLLRGLVLALQFAESSGGIGLTAKGAFNRKFVHWAAIQFQWPGFAAESLFDENKQLNETDFLPLSTLRDLALRLKFLRKSKSCLVASGRGLALLKNPASEFDGVASEYLFGVPQGSEQVGEVFDPLNLWASLLRLVELKGDQGSSPLELLRDLYPDLATKSDLEVILKTWAVRSDLKFDYLRRLCWLGLIHEDRRHRRPTEDGIYYKTPLWTACVDWQTDSRKELVLH